MTNDPVIDRIREARHQISEECGHDPEKLIEYYIRRQNKRLADHTQQTDDMRKARTVSEAGKSTKFCNRECGSV